MQGLVEKGLVTQAQLDEMNRNDAEIRAEHERYRASECAGRPLSCWIEDHEPWVRSLRGRSEDLAIRVDGQVPDVESPSK